LPKADFPELRQAGFGSFIDMDLEGITYKNSDQGVSNLDFELISCIVES